MDKFKRYYGIILFTLVIIVVLYIMYNIIMPKVDEIKTLTANIEKEERNLTNKKDQYKRVMEKYNKLKNSISTSPKKVYSPLESDLGNDTLFFTLYNDLVEMIHSNSVKIKAIDYTHNPESDNFVKFGKDVYFVCDIELELVSNYVNLGKLLEDIYQYPYYIKINELSVKPFEKDKKILISKLNLRLYAHTSPEEPKDIVADKI